MSIYRAKHSLLQKIKIESVGAIWTLTLKNREHYVFRECLGNALRSLE